MGLSREERVDRATLEIVNALIKYRVAFRAPSDDDGDELVFLVPIEDTREASFAVH